MSKKDNLTDFLKDVANTIRTNDGTSDAINPQDFSTRISNTVGSNITKRSSSDLSYSNYTLNVPAGYYKDKATLSATNSFDIYASSLCPNQSTTITTQPLNSNTLYKQYRLTQYPLYWTDLVLHYNGTVVANLMNQTTEPSVSLTYGKLYLLELYFDNPGVSQGKGLFVENTVISWDDVATVDDYEVPTTFYFLFQFNYKSGYWILYYIGDDVTSYNEPPREVACVKTLGNYKVGLYADELENQSSGAELYIYENNFMSTYVPSVLTSPKISTVKQGSTAITDASGNKYYKCNVTVTNKNSVAVTCSGDYSGTIAANSSVTFSGTYYKVTITFSATDYISKSTTSYV